MNEFNFATPTAEGEYRAKAAKLKLPVNSFKKNNNKNSNNKNQQPVQTVEEIQNEIQPVEINVENPSVIAQSETEKRENNKNNRRNRNKRSKFDRNREQQQDNQPQMQEEVPVAQTFIKPNEELKVEVPMAQEAQPSTPATEIQPEEKQKSGKKGRRGSKKQKDTPAAEVQAAENQQPPAVETPAVEAPQEEKKVRRPNRGSSKRSRNKKVSAENVEE